MIIIIQSVIITIVIMWYILYIDENLLQLGIYLPSRSLFCFILQLKYYIIITNV